MAAELPGQDGLFPAPCGCYSCNGQCGGTSEPGSCGPLLAIAGERLCETCRSSATAFANDGSNREGIQSVPTTDSVRLAAGVFSGRPERLWLTPAMARVLAKKLLADADLTERYILRHEHPGCLCLMFDPAAYCPVHNRR
jgi:hypothetical protein